MGADKPDAVEDGTRLLKFLSSPLARRIAAVVLNEIAEVLRAKAKGKR
jgi:hypothetical protein